MKKFVYIIKGKLKEILPKPLLFIYRSLCRWQDLISLIEFFFNKSLGINFIQRLAIVRKICIISTYIHCDHGQKEILSFIETILLTPKQRKGCIVEAGCYKGGSAAKFSIAAQIAGRELFVFDSFEGMPQHHEPHDKNIFGGIASFPKGSYRCGLEEVKRMVTAYGHVDVCKFIKGWFKETLPGFSLPIAAAYLDVDLASSTRTCLKYFYPLLAPGGIIYSHDGHLPLVIEVFNDDFFWEKEIGCSKPQIEGLGKQKVLRIVKPVKIDGRQKFAKSAL